MQEFFTEFGDTIGGINALLGLIVVVVGAVSSLVALRRKKETNQRAPSKGWDEFFQCEHVAGSQGETVGSWR